MKNIALVIFDYFEYGGIQKDLDALGKMLRAQAPGKQLKLTMLCMHNRSGVLPSWCDEAREILPPWYKFSNHRRAEWFDKQLKKIRQSNEFDLLVGFNRIGSLDFYFAGDDCLKEKYLKRSKLSSLLPRGKIFLGLERKVFSAPEAGGAKKIFAITENQRASFMRQYPECGADRFLLMPPNLADEYFDRCNMAELRKEARKEFGVSDNTILLIQIAAAFRTKGIDRSLETFGEAEKRGILNDFKFVIVGGTSQKAQDEMKKIALDCGISQDEVIFTGPRNDIRRLLCGADLMFHPARAEAAGSVIIEALASGVPVVSSAICGYKTYIEAANAGIIIPEPFELDQSVEALQKALENLPELHANAISYAENHITPANFQRARTETDIILKTLE